MKYTMKLYPKNSIFGLQYKQWTYLEACAYCLKGIMREHPFFLNFYKKIASKAFVKKWLKHDGEESYFDFNGVKLPDVSNHWEKMNILRSVFDDVFLIPCFFNDNYEKSVVDFVDQYTNEGPYGYREGAFDVTLKKGDIVIDAGAWIGDFSAYAVSKGAAASYAFEPVNETFQWLCKTKSLNYVKGGGVYPIQKGLGDREYEMDISINEDNSGANSVVYKWDKSNRSERVIITTLDKFVEENKPERVDFIKADIEGAERDMLKGASGVLKTFAPKLAICTYHLPDDPDVLEKIILDANPNYTVVRMRHKLFAAVIRQ
jgi:FkbM family methyltransferase